MADDIVDDDINSRGASIDPADNLPARGIVVKESMEPQIFFESGMFYAIFYLGDFFKNIVIIGRLNDTI